MSSCSPLVLAAWFASLLLVANSAADDAARLFRIVTFNAELLAAPGVKGGQLERFRFDHARRVHCERVAHLIETLKPDLLNLVEVTSKPAVDLIVSILHEKGLTDYRGYHIDSSDPFTGGDVACICRFPLDEIDGVAIRTINSPPNDPTWQQAFTFTERDGQPGKGFTSLSRNSLYFATIAGRKLAFVGLHLKSNPEDSYSNGRRTAEKEIVLRLIRSEVLPRGYQPVILGDLNDYDPEIDDADPTRKTATTVIRDLKDFDKQRPGPELFNVLSHIPRVADRYTSHWDWNENGAGDPQDVYTAIDHILLPVELESHVTRAFICHSTGLDTSDHFAVVVDLQLTE